MLRKSRPLTLFCLLQLFTVSAIAETAGNNNQRLTYLGTNQYPIKNAEMAREYGFLLSQHNLDALNNLEAEITKGLPLDNLAEAQRIANERFNQLSEEQGVELLRGPARLVQWDIKKLPAFVFGDGQYVIYGVTDTDAALRRYRNSRRR